MNKYRKGDVVTVISGKEKGKTATIQKVLVEQAKVVLDKANLVKRHLKPRQDFQGGIVEMPSPMPWSKVMLACKKCDRPVKVKIVIENGVKHRQCKLCGESLS